MNSMLHESDALGNLNNGELTRKHEICVAGKNDEWNDLPPRSLLGGVADAAPVVTPCAMKRYKTLPGLKSLKKGDDVSSIKFAVVLVSYFTVRFPTFAFFRSTGNNVFMNLCFRTEKGRIASLSKMELL